MVGRCAGAFNLPLGLILGRAMAWMVRFTLRDLFALVAKAACLMPAVLVAPTPPAALCVLAALIALLAIELMVSSAGVTAPVPRIYGIAFFVSRLALAYSVCLLMDFSLFLAMAFRSASPPLREVIGQAFVLAFFLSAAWFASVVSCVCAAIAWRKDRRARWIVYLNGAFLIGSALLCFFA